ncbi:hypothetical protein L596_023022 [Steinernema carpocapsae]|uniref:G-protein coupled receptors family 1 profile domain-containing protein n=1 Tax=Steinernema carpocapsae TaxID=34508 RepID=A0A4U5MCL9_STECR|nr:hypothetical protein L596_023022 [Steinernema carpocapsae]
MKVLISISTRPFLDENRSYEIIFWTGVFVYSIEFVIGVGNIFIAFDRFLAIQSPIHYCQSYSQVVLKLYVTVLPLIICVTLVICILNRKITELGTIFGHVVNMDVVYMITLCNSFASFLAMPVSGIFLYSLYKFNKRQTAVLTDSSSVRMRRTNQMVIYQLFLEMVLVVIPITTNTVLNYGFGINLPAIFGPFVQLFFVIYTSACSVLFTVKLNRNERTTRVEDLRSAVP